MRISAELRYKIVNELEFIIERIEKNDDPRIKNYFFSASYGIIERVKREEFDPQLLMMEVILNSIHDQLEQTMNRYSSGATVPPPPPFEEIFDPIGQKVVSLKDTIKEERDERIYHILEEMFTYMYSLSGPGYYDKEKGLVK